MHNWTFLRLMIIPVLAFIAIFVVPAIINHEPGATTSNESQVDEVAEVKSTEPETYDLATLEQSAEGPRMSEEERAKHAVDVAKYEFEIIALARGSQEEQKIAIQKVKQFYSAINSKPAWFAEFARPIRNNLRNELPGSAVTAIAEEAVIMHGYKTGVVSDRMEAQLIAYANVYDGQRPINLIRRISNDLLNKNKTRQAISFLKRAQRGLTEGTDNLAIQQHLKMVEQASVQTAPVHVGRRPTRDPVRAKGRHAHLVGTSPMISGPTASGGTASTYSLRGKAVVVHVWAPW
ncbi:MAG: hypothetical protein KDB27_17465 [Planctomycetales bacterium]|nr:hypothetical protein [Planctomycetales bacterium]